MTRIERRDELKNFIVPKPSIIPGQVTQNNNGVLKVKTANQVYTATGQGNPGEQAIVFDDGTTVTAVTEAPTTVSRFSEARKYRRQPPPVQQRGRIIGIWTVNDGGGGPVIPDGGGD